MTELLDEILEAHGGRDRWLAARQITARVRTGGLLPRTRFPGNRLADYQVSVDPRRPRALLDPFPGAGRRGVFDRASARIETSDGEVVAERDDARASFSGWSSLRRNLRWDPIDSTYFAGYAMWTYLTVPSLLLRDDVEIAEGPQRQGPDGPWRSLDARFPEPRELPSHSREQRFWFDRAGLQVRHDYTAEVVGRWARAAHHCDRHREFDGLVFPTVRRVRPLRRNGEALPFPTLVALEIEQVSVAFEPEPTGGEGGR